MAIVRYTNIDGEVVAEKRLGVRRAFVPDVQGSTVAMLGSNQTITDTAVYWPFGEIQSRTESLPVQLLFVGTLGYRTDVPNSIYVRARQLSTLFGRWFTVDPSRFDINDYSYADDSPVEKVDASGLIPSKASSKPCPRTC